MISVILKIEKQKKELLNQIPFTFSFISFAGSLCFDKSFAPACLVLSILPLIWDIFTDRQSLWRYVFCYFLFQNAIQQKVTAIAYTVVTYSDEFAAIIMLAVILILAIEQKADLLRFEKYIVVFQLLFVIWGFIGNIVFGYQRLLLGLVDVLTCSRFLIYYFGARIVYTRYLKKKLLILRAEDGFNQYFGYMAKCVTVTLFFFLVHDLIFSPFFEKGDYRYFTYSIKLCFGHSTNLAMVCIICIVILISGFRYDRHAMRYIVLLSIITLFTFRMKAIVAVVCIFAVYFLVIRRNVKSKTLVGMAVGGSALAIGFRQFARYYLSTSHTLPIRQKMTQDAVALANRHFPFGTGFGTFGSATAYDFASRIYKKLGYFGRYYINQPLSDTFWPIVIAQSGWIGLLLFIPVILLLCNSSIKRLRKDPYSFWASFSVLVYSLICSTSESAFFHPSIMPLFIILGIVNAKYYWKNNVIV